MNIHPIPLYPESRVKECQTPYSQKKFHAYVIYLGDAKITRYRDNIPTDIDEAMGICKEIAKEGIFHVFQYYPPSRIERVNIYECEE